ncbi:MAG: hypothetical protein ACK56F_10085, partial [bacterium]
AVGRGPGVGPRDGAVEAVASAAVAVDVVVLHEALSEAHEDRLTDLDAGVVAVGDAVVGAVGVGGALVTDDGEVVHHAGGHGLVVRLLGAVDLDGVVAHTRALGRIGRVAL